MVCIYCGGETQVVNSRHQKRSNQVWRRRQCQTCQGIFTSYEAADLTGSLLFRATLGHVEPFQRDYLFLSVHQAVGHRKTAAEDARALTDTIVGRLRGHIQDAGIERTQLVSVTTEVLKRFDRAAASAYAAYHPL